MRLCGGGDGRGWLPWLSDFEELLAILRSEEARGELGMGTMAVATPERLTELRLALLGRPRLSRRERGLGAWLLKFTTLLLFFRVLEFDRPS